MRAPDERGSFFHHQDLADALREELDARDDRIAQRLDAIAKAQDDINRKLAQWETGAVIVRWLAISTAGIVTSGIALAEWLRDHLK